MTTERCKHDLSTDQCGECRQPPPGLTKRVIITHGGQVFHRTAACAALHDGQRFAERRGQEAHDPVVVALSEAQSDGRAACAACFPDYKPGDDRQAKTDREHHSAPQGPVHHSPSRADALNQLTVALDTARRSVSAALAAGVDRDQLTDIVAHALIDIRAQVWPTAAPAHLTRSNRETKS